MYSELRNKEFGIIDLLRSGWKIFQKHFLSILIITLLINLPFNLLLEGASVAGVDQTTYWRINIQAGAILSIFTSITVFVIVEREILGKKIKVWSALKKASLRYPSGLGSSFLFGLSFVIRLLLIIPGIMFLVNTAFYLHAVGLRNQGWKAALDYSINLVKNHFWKVFYTFLVIVLVILIFPSFIFSLLIELIFGSPEQGTSSAFLPNIINLLFSDLAGYLYDVTGTVFFLNMDYRASVIVPNDHASEPTER